MTAAQRMTHRTGAAALATMVAAFGVLGAARAADLPRYPGPPPRPPSPSAYPYGSIAPDPGPASSNGYYGYYGFDIGGTPYDGLYSADVVCLRSVRTPRGYRTVDVCRSD